MLPVRLMLGKECRARGADVGVLRAQQRLGLQDVRAAREQIRRQPGRNVGEDLLVVQAHGRRQVRGQRLAEQQHERVFRLRAKPHLGGEVGVGLLEDRLRLLQAELGRGAGVELEP